MPTPDKNPIIALLHSRKFLLLILDTVISVALYFASRFDATHFDDIKYLIVTLQPVFVFLIGAIAYEDKAAQEAASRVQIARLGVAEAQTYADAEKSKLAATPPMMGITFGETRKQ